MIVLCLPRDSLLFSPPVSLLAEWVARYYSQIWDQYKLNLQWQHLCYACDFILAAAESAGNWFSLKKPNTTGCNFFLDYQYNYPFPWGGLFLVLHQQYPISDVITHSNSLGPWLKNTCKSNHFVFVQYEKERKAQTSGYTATIIRTAS